MPKLAVTLRTLAEHNHIVGDIPRGLKIYKGGGVRILEMEPNFYAAQVPHKKGDTKTVTVSFTNDGRNIEHHYCHCTWRSRGTPPVCRHVVAAVLAIQSGEVPDADKPLVDFLLRAKKAAYAGKGAESASSRSNSHDFEYSEGNLKYIDTYLGGEKFAGEEAVWKDGIPCWAMNYAGRVVGDGFSGDFLKEALLLVSEDAPFRGPPEYASGDYSYTCGIKGGFSWFRGLEEVHYKGVKVYECMFHGGEIV